MAHGSTLIERNMSKTPFTCVSFGSPSEALGIVLLPGTLDAEAAVRITKFANLNPGGSVVISHMPDDVSDELYAIVQRNQYKLLMPDEVKAIFPTAVESRSPAHIIQNGG